MYRRCRCCWGWDVIHWWCTEPWTWTSAITNSKGQAPNIFCVCLQRKPRRVLCINMLFLFFSTCMCAYTHVYAPLLYSYMWHKMENLTQCFPVSCLHYIIILGIVFILSHCQFSWVSLVGLELAAVLPVSQGMLLNTPLCQPCALLLVWGFFNFVLKQKCII
jgi:hypothetical protein